VPQPSTINVCDGHLHKYRLDFIFLARLFVHWPTLTSNSIAPSAKFFFCDSAFAPENHRQRGVLACPSNQKFHTANVFWNVRWVDTHTERDIHTDTHTRPHPHPHTPTPALAHPPTHTYRERHTHTHADTDTEHTHKQTHIHTQRERHADTHREREMQTHTHTRGRTSFRCQLRSFRSFLKHQNLSAEHKSVHLLAKWRSTLGVPMVVSVFFSVLTGIDI